MSDLTGRDLRGFSSEARELILEAQERGADVRISRNGHAIMRYADKSCSVPPKLKMSNRAAQNSRAAVKRMFREEGQ